MGRLFNLLQYSISSTYIEQRRHTVEDRPIIAVDFDDVIADFNSAYVEYSKKKYKTTITYETANTFDMPKLYGVSPAEIVSRVRTFCYEHHDSISPIVDTAPALKILSERYILHVVTSRCQTLSGITEGWLQDYQMLDYFEDLHFTNGFGSTYAKKRTKLEVVQGIGAKVLIEDAPGHALELSNAGYPVLLPDRPWNKKVEDILIYRMPGWIPIKEWLFNRMPV